MLPFGAANVAIPSIAFGVGNPSSIGSPSLLITRYSKPAGNARSSPAGRRGPYPMPARPCGSPAKAARATRASKRPPPRVVAPAATAERAKNWRRRFRAAPSSPVSTVKVCSARDRPDARRRHQQPPACTSSTSCPPASTRLPPNCRVSRACDELTSGWRSARASALDLKMEVGPVSENRSTWKPSRRSSIGRPHRSERSFRPAS